MNEILEKKIKENTLIHLKSLENQDSADSLFNKTWWHGKVMDWTLKKPEFKTKMFHFIDVLPSLTNDRNVLNIFKEYFEDENGKLPALFQTGLGLGALAPKIAAATIRKNITQMSEIFITAENPQKALKKISSKKSNITQTFDLLGEAVVSEQEAQEYQARYDELIDELIKFSKQVEHNPITHEDAKGPIPKANVSIKLSAFYSQIKVEDWTQSLCILKDRLRPFFKKAKDNFLFLNLDMEDYALKELTLQVFKDLVLENEFKDYPHYGIVLQAYLKDSPKDADILIELAKTRRAPFTIRLVKGAYWDYEVIHANQMNWPCPVFEKKHQTDANYENLCKKLLENHPHIRIAFASHNIRSLSAALTIAKDLNIPDKDIEVQMLYGMMNEYKNYFANHNYRVREYATVGEILPGMAYLVRRLLENTANDSFLQERFASQDDYEKLAKSPQKVSCTKDDQIKEAQTKKAAFTNHPPLDFTLEHERTSLQQSLDKLKKQLPLEVTPIIDGKPIKTKDIHKRFNPSNTSECVGQIHYADKGHCDKALESLTKGTSKWAEIGFLQRAAKLKKLAKIIQSKKYDLMALEILEVGKSWSEADGDICEAIDFCNYYAQLALEMESNKTAVSVLGEKSSMTYIPRGITAVIAPWNFPLAILTGLTVSSLVTGNTVAIKPAEQSSVMGYRLALMLKEAGFDTQAFTFLPGQGELIGAHLAESPLVSTISFTGSKDVGLKLIRESKEKLTWDHNVKKCVVEMGGKNTLIIDSSADLDEAVKGAVSSAFSFQGQKCSALSRILVHKDCYDTFIKRFLEATKSLNIGPMDNPKNYIGPLVDEEALSKAQRAIQQAKDKGWGECALEMSSPSQGHYLGPTIFCNVKTDSALFTDEFFAPVIAIAKMEDLNEGIDLINSDQYALTAGIYSRSPKNLRLVHEKMNVGNVYLNRSITGSIVGRHPFGGFKLSGVGDKAGGPNYLKQFTHERVTTENTLRRGFSPDTSF